MENLPGDYIAGFVDGEGCFALKFRRDVKYRRPNAPAYFYWDIEFAIGLRSDDKELLEKIQRTLGCGRISVNRRGMARYSVQRIEDLTTNVVPFFDNYRLYGKKRFDFTLWKEAVEIFKRNQRVAVNIRKGERRFHKTEWDPKDIRRLAEIQRAMKPYKSKRTDEWKWLPSAGS